ncbi:MAG: glycosyltransferase family 2 protein [Paracoccaceae bacterium]|nr:glycosyltransferase family 2 protein [Paracoccaceae bacterium]
MMKDEGPYVLEWVAHHLAVGFTDILVYTNDCSDGTDAMLQRLEELGLAHHRENRIPEGQRPQPSALNYAQSEPLVAQSDWLLVFDADEFLSISYGDGSLDGLISAAKDRDANGIVITWRIFGSGGVQHWSRAPVTEQYLMAAPQMWNKGWGVKTLFQFDPEHWKLGIHRPKIKNRWLDTDWPQKIRWLNGSGRPMEDYFRFRGWRSIVRTVGYDWAQMNHYAVKSIDAYAMRKFRGNVNFKKDKYNTDYWALQDRNEVRDDTMLRYHDERKRIFDALLRDPVLNRLHFAALERAEARLAEFKGTAEYEAFVAGLKAASAVPITQVEAKPPKARDPERIAALMSDVEKRAAAVRVADKADRPPAPLDLYVRGPVDLSARTPLEWFANHTLMLPGDARVFTPLGLDLLRAGKFERNLARNLPRILPQGARVAELGAGCGFLAAYLSRIRPDLTWAAQETAPGMETVLRGVWQLNGVTGDKMRIVPAGAGEDLPAFLNEGPWDLLMIGDPSMTPDVLTDLPAPPGAAMLIGRCLCDTAPDFSDWQDLFEDWGLTDPLPFDATAAYGFRRPPADQ